MNKLKISKAREIYRHLNRLNLYEIDYEYVKSNVNKFVESFRAQAFKPIIGQELFRGIIYDEKPTQLSYLGAPPKEKVKNFQRCNAPYSPMFYCSVNPAAVLSEIGVKKGDLVYLSKWKVINPEFFITQVVPEFPEGMSYPALDVVYAYIETKFTQPIHEVFSSHYKITAAITELLSSRETKGDEPNIGGVIYPSVAHPSRSENLVLYPDVAEEHLVLKYVEELEVKSCEKDEIEIVYKDIATDFSENKINWENRPRVWELQHGDRVKFVNEGAGWHVFDMNNNVFDPS